MFLPCPPIYTTLKTVPMVQPTYSRQVSERILDFLRGIDTCTVSNAIESFNVRPRNEGFIQDACRCQFPKLPPIVGYALTGRIRTGSQPIANLCYYHRTDWWEYVQSWPSPKIIVLHDADPLPGIGAFVGEIHAGISKALGCVAYVTNGTIRDLPAVEAAGFQCFAAGTSVSHSYAHIVDFGEPVDIGGLEIAPGDLLHGDCHGVQTIPLSIAEELPKAVKSVRDREADLIRFCESPEFSLQKLVTILNRELPACQPPKWR
jgi:4-hydroxy-4-methyl-2-oxoglutarate aldolase